MYTCQGMATASKKTTTKKSASPDASFAVIKTGGKQYVVRVGDVLSVEKLEGTFTPGDTLVFDEVLLLDNGTRTEMGTPTLAQASVKASFVAEGKGKKIDVIKYKAKSRYFKKRGHRQPYMKFQVTEISGL